MSLYRTLLATVAAMALASPVLADDTSMTTNATATTAAQSATADAATPATDTKLNLNMASAKELMKVKGLNAAKARAIVAYRKKHGNFKTVNDLMNVKGFKKMKADTVKDVQSQLIVE